MEFITLREALYAIEARVSGPKGSGEFADEIISSEATGLLHQALSNNSKSRPQWVEKNKISGKPIFNDTAVYPEAMAMLEHASGYHARSAKNRSNHIFSCLKSGLDPNEVHDVIHPADSPFPGVQFFRPREIGFDRAELVAFLDKNQIGHNLTPSPAPVPPAPPVMADSAHGGVEADKAGPVNKKWVMKKAALINKHTCQWATIKGDFHSASENGLSQAAKAPGHGEWFEADALKWAEQRGKLKKEEEQGPATLATVWTGKKHTLRD